ncbi:MAG: Peptidyl-tRNA hydrolase [Parcubacteria group bacterium ADurb.Bin326]|nr:MAG: Peptidyl-tRNA hydrolase [Parcubacteria group bacterium ADurb.Bin326]
MKLVVGLGNPGKKYENTWHNIGFMAVDKTAYFLYAPKFKESSKFLAETGSVTNRRYSDKIILAKPLTFMNLSGKSVLALANFYKIKPEDIIVIHDDIDLPLGKMRISFDSSAGGHNGIKSIIESLGTKKFCRIKIGMATKRKSLMDSADYVLNKFTKDDLRIVEAQTSLAAEAAIEIIRSSVNKAMNKYN